jgi:hypothetical protein
MRWDIPKKTIVIARSAPRDEAIDVLKNTGLLHPRKPWVRNDEGGYNVPRNDDVTHIWTKSIYDGIP